MIVITRNGKTTVYTGWRAWLLVAIALVVTWGLFAFFALAFLGIAVSVAVLMLLLIPAAMVVALIMKLTRARS